MRCSNSAARLLTGALLLTLLGVVAAQASDITYTTSGTIASKNEPDSTLYGVSGAPLSGVFEYKSWPDEIPREYLPAGSLNVIPIEINNGAPWPSYIDSPFDVRISFDRADLPSLELKGVFNQWPSPDWAGTVTSIESSSPLLDANLPPLFADMLAHPEMTSVRVGSTDWGIANVPVWVAYQPYPTPEPATVLVLGAGIVTILGYRHHRRRSRPPVCHGECEAGAEMTTGPY